MVAHHFTSTGYGKQEDSKCDARRDAHPSAPSPGGGASACEHLFVTSQGSAYSRFQRALSTGNLQLIEAAAAELPKVSLEDALGVLIVLAQRGDPRFERAAARWVGRLLTETPADLSDARFALALVERLPTCRDALHGLARRR